ncbi:WapI family immunity protein [Winogradskyella sp. PC D3.3]
MIFNGINNQSVEFRITNYQFPEITNCEYDSNWLLVYLKVKSDCGNWQTVDPSLLVGDLKDIKDWFEKLSNNIETDSDSLVFMEPNLEFELTKKNLEEKHIRIIFDLEFRPQSADDDKDYFVDCIFNNNELKLIVKELEKQVEQYPRRAI